MIPERSVVSGLPSEETLAIELLKIRAAIPSTDSKNAAGWARSAVKEISSLRHTIKFFSPFGEVEIIASDIKALDWIIHELTENADSSK